MDVGAEVPKIEKMFQLPAYVRGSFKGGAENLSGHALSNIATPFLVSSVLFFVLPLSKVVLGEADTNHHWTDARCFDKTNLASST